MWMCCGVTPDSELTGQFTNENGSYGYAHGKYKGASLEGVFPVRVFVYRGIFDHLCEKNDHLWINYGFYF